MRILVCAKQVPDSTVKVKVAADARSIVSEGITWAISPYDEYAVELALERKDADPATIVSVVSVGAQRARDALRQALAMGCDEASLVTGEGAEALGPYALARVLAAIVGEQRPDLVICGKQAADDDLGLVGPALAEALGWPHVANVEAIDVVGGAPELRKATEGGHEVWKATGPAVLTAQKSEKEPRYPSLPGIMKAKKKELPERDVRSLGVDLGGPLTELVELRPPPARRAGKILKDGDPKALAAALATLLRDEAKVL